MFDFNFQNLSPWGIFIEAIRFLGWLIFWTWWIPAGYFAFLSWQKKRQREWVAKQKFSLFLIQIPKDNEKTPVAAEMMFASLHGIFKSAKKRFYEGSLQEHISFEIASIDQRIRFYVWVPQHLKDFVEGQIYAQYPGAEITPVEDYTNIEMKEEMSVAATELVLTKEDFYPIRTFPNFEVDPLAGITSTLSKLESQNEQIWIQILIRPADEKWQASAISFAEAIRSGQAPKKITPQNLIEKLVKFIADIIQGVLTPPQQAAPPQAPVKLSPSVESQLTALEEKSQKLGFSTKIRILYISQNPQLAQTRLQAVVGAFKQFTASNSFAAEKVVEGKEAINLYKSRYFYDPGYVLNIEELASIYHLPNTSVETPNILWTGAKKGEPPDNLPLETTVPKEELTIIGKTNFRHLSQKFGIKSDDRRRHIYIIGKTGVGKTTLMQNMILDDIRENRGVAVVDPHGDFIDQILDFIPSYRINDVILFDPADRDYPIAFNPLEEVSADQRGLVVSGIISIFQKIWAYTWGPRLEHILRNTLAALIEYPNSTMLGINRMFTDKKFRKKVVQKVTDVETKRFWTQEFPMYEKNERFKTEAIAPIQNKVGQFVASPTIRNIIGQPKSNIDMRKIMDEGKILLVKLSQGAIGEDNSALLGAMIITKLQLAAMSRVDISEEQRRDFYLYVDEFQNFATESFAKILSEARKYHLNLTLANQYVAQMIDKVRDAVFGNVGTLICFRVGAQDASFIAKELEPVFNETDVVNLDKYNIYLKMSIDGVTCPAFSAQTLPPPSEDEKKKHQEKIITTSRERYSRPREFVEKKIAEWMKIEFEENEEIIKEELASTELPASLKVEGERISFEDVLEEAAKEITGKEIIEKSQKEISTQKLSQRELEVGKEIKFLEEKETLKKPQKIFPILKNKENQVIKPGEIIKFEE